ncbi:hypothetical protein BU17DRAFT_86156 [Hysterangium stoloniferum]|nr:hypothetical protein BU17DRAFT_86156 [Hysterangium stoloniferum]
MTHQMHLLYFQESVTGMEVKDLPVALGMPISNERGKGGNKENGTDIQASSFSCVVPPNFHYLPHNSSPGFLSKSDVNRYEPIEKRVDHSSPSSSCLHKTSYYFGAYSGPHFQDPVSYRCYSNSAPGMSAKALGSSEQENMIYITPTDTLVTPFMNGLASSPSHKSTDLMLNTPTSSHGAYSYSSELSRSPMREKTDEHPSATNDSFPTHLVVSLQHATSPQTIASQSSNVLASPPSNRLHSNMPHISAGHHHVFSSQAGFKAARGRRVPTLAEFDEAAHQSRKHVCNIHGCNLRFKRLEHVRRHQRTCHSFAKRQP